MLTRHSGHPYFAADHICRRDITDNVTKAVKASSDWFKAVQETLDRLGVTGEQRTPFFRHAESVANLKGL